MSLIALTLFLVLALIAARSYFLSFRAQKSAQYIGTSPAFDIRTHLSGPIQSEGVIFGPTGRAVSRFVAEMEGSWEGSRGILTERFHYSSGDVQNRAWHLTMGNDGTFTAEADDIIGKAHGRMEGATVRMTYRIRLKEDAGGHVLDVTDWMYLMENGAIMNKSEMRKAGIKVAELIATMRGQNAAA
ncbi:hypothetical protein PSA7680_03528 [Pseudoruegeria aquimaris]|uniref:DUF3833 domain-containing protein n=1 Tax=Pseudoruegeria aquimaris TaxID=393663 RepID=A0A1Y5TLU7_9RHOB|nr:DUF3833 domain-containing protein [Pseudoruegeria aquimaris]SLN66636.1 hypothetical protein PSA7680_03528 [Pseudoruegeria aquimaris]